MQKRMGASELTKGRQKSSIGELRNFCQRTPEPMRIRASKLARRIFLDAKLVGAGTGSDSGCEIAGRSCVGPGLATLVVGLAKCGTYEPEGNEKRISPSWPGS